MSVKNKVKDRDYHGKIKRKYTGPESTFWLNTKPSHWVRLYMNVPKRRRSKKLCRDILLGKDPEGMIFPTGNKKPHVYYW